jgi:hypothetical protein
MEGCGEEKRNGRHRPETWKHSYEGSDQNPDETEKKVHWLKRNPKTKEDVVKNFHSDLKDPFEDSFRKLGLEPYLKNKIGTSRDKGRHEKDGFKAIGAFDSK